MFVRIFKFLIMDFIFHYFFKFGYSIWLVINLDSGSHFLDN